MRHRPLRRFVSALLCFVGAHSVPSPSFAQPIHLDNAQRAALVERTAALVDSHYIFPDRAAAVAAALEKQERSGAYGADKGLDDFLGHVNRDMQTAGNDRHLKLNFNPKVVAQLRKDVADQGEVDSGYVRLLEENNYRLKRVEHLEGNIGYFKFDNFVELRFVKEAFVGAMNFVRHSSALVLDLTENGGGAAETADFLVGYFLPAGTRIGETWNRATGETAPDTVAASPGVTPMLDTPLVILVGPGTASAAEAVAYSLQQAKRAVVIGSRTKGMANSGELFPIDDRFYVMVPTHLHKNAATGTNWEGSGVVPNIAVAPEKTLAAGIAEALARAAERNADPKEAYRLRFLAQPYQAEVSPQSPPPGFLAACVGEYEDGQQIVAREGTLHFVKGDHDRTLRYMADRTFTVDGRTDYRVRFDAEGGRAAALRVVWFDDTEDRYRKVK
jgi:hypothetical protein